MTMSPDPRTIRISIVIPSFNQATYLDEALRSLITQEYPNKELIVMDGGSTDGSVDVIRKHESHIAFWRSGPDGGQARAIESGFALATGKIIGWLNSDDVLKAGALERVAEVVCSTGNPDGVYYGGHEVIDANSQIQEVFLAGKLPTPIARAIGPAICQPGTFFGRDAYLDVGGLDHSLHYAMDLDLWMRFLTKGVKFHMVPAVQAQFRRHPYQKGHSLEWLDHCATESRMIEKKYEMAPTGSLRRKVMRNINRMTSLLSGKPLITMAFRLSRHRRFREFSVNYSG